MNLQEKMFREFEDKKIFEQARSFAFDYLNTAFERNVFPSEEAIGNLDEFAEELPAHPGEAASILAQLHRYGSPATVAQIGGRYFGFVNGGVIPVSLAARWLSDVWDQNAALYVISPLVSKLEEIVEGWFRQLLGLPERVVAGFVSGSSTAIFCGLAAARYRVLQNNNWDVNRKGLNGAPKIRVVAGRHAHATVIKAVALLGFGVDNIEWIDTDVQGRVAASAVPPLDGRTILILQAGNVNSGAFDDFESICKQAREAGAWIHIDGAFGLWAAASQQLRHLTRGIEYANSWSVDGHKTLNTPYDSGIVLCDDKEALVHALQASGAYIAYSDHKDGMLYTPEMSRRARAVELWAALKYLGKSGVDELVSGLHRRAAQFGRELQENGFTVLNDVVFNQVLVSCGDDELTRRTLKYIQQSGECWVGGSTWFDRAVIRISVCSWATTREDVSRSVRAFVAARDKAAEHSGQPQPHL
ncbi:MAG: aspartate aminotransferase family protein [Chloroflexi bacterium]|nr:MAG: aspartate aminotransferase family protein [Chloroflexota bacterium]